MTTFLSWVDPPVCASQIVNMVDSRGFTLLDLAVNCGNSAAVSILFSFGATLLPFSSSSPLIAALKKQNSAPSKEVDEIVETFLSGWTYKHTVTIFGPATKEHRQLLAIFIKRYKHLTLQPFQTDPAERYRLWQEAVDSLGNSSMLLDILLGTNPDGLKAATGVKIHAAFNYLTESQMQSLNNLGVNLAFRHEGAKLHFWAVQAANVPIVRILLDSNAGLEITDVDTDGNTLLHWAVFKTVGRCLQKIQFMIFFIALHGFHSSI